MSRKICLSDYGDGIGQELDQLKALGNLLAQTREDLSPEIIHTVGLMICDLTAQARARVDELGWVVPDS